MKILENVVFFVRPGEIGSDGVLSRKPVKKLVNRNIGFGELLLCSFYCSAIKHSLDDFGESS